ncbi:Ubiquitin-protein ligase E3B [Fasciola gigantica]|uniref:HECT-type E3 ubiquitin transferase n=1 Tax=Fasciola gigantica TaxID=46835 RepID=A0A504YC85_FASGI|nr:Ubiquitin-protein ligase E3B [Fasciola gigantica]
MTFVTKQLRLLWNGRMVRMLFGDLYAETELDDPESKNGTFATAAAVAAGPSSSRSSAVATTIPDSSPTRRPAASLASFTSRGFDLDHYKGRVRHGLTNFLHQLSLSRAKRKFRTGLTSVASAAGAGGAVGFGSSYSSSGSGSISPAGPNDLPESLKGVCMLYCFTVASLREIRNDILAGLSLGDLLPRLWRLVARCGTVQDWVKVLMDSKLGVHAKPHASHLLHIFTAAASNLLSILDDVELFELDKSFTADELCSMGAFFNQLVYETVLAAPDPWALHSWSSPTAPKPSVGEPLPTTKSESAAVGTQNSTACTLPGLFTMCLRLLSIIYERDSRHPFTPPDFWLIPNLKVSAFLADFCRNRTQCFGSC